MYDLSDFFGNLMQGLLLITNLLRDITFQFNTSTLSLLDMIEYAIIVSIVLTAIKQMSYNGLFTISKKNRERLSHGSDRFEGKA